MAVAMRRHREPGNDFINTLTFSWGVDNFFLVIMVLVTVIGSTFVP